MNGTCGMHGRQERCVQGFGGGGGGALGEGNHLEDLGIDGWVILIWSSEKWDGEAWNGLIWLRIGTGCVRL